MTYIQTNNIDTSKIITRTGGISSSVPSYKFYIDHNDSYNTNANIELDSINQTTDLNKYNYYKLYTKHNKNRY